MSSKLKVLVEHELCANIIPKGNKGANIAVFCSERKIFQGNY